MIHRHAQCERCARTARMHRKLDWFGRIDDTTAPPEGHEPVTKGAIVVRDLRNGSLHEGVDAVRLIFRQVPFYLPLLLLLKIPAVARAADADARGLRSKVPCQPDSVSVASCSRRGEEGDETR